VETNLKVNFKACLSKGKFFDLRYGFKEFGGEKNVGTEFTIRRTFDSFRETKIPKIEKNESNEVFI